MSVTKANLMKACMRKWRRTGRRAMMIPANESFEFECCKWCLWNNNTLHGEEEKDNIVPSDVPKGHVVVYVGECDKRFVIKLSLLNNPLFRALLDEAREVYGFDDADSRLRIPCDETIFLDIVQSAKKSTAGQRFGLCL